MAIFWPAHVISFGSCTPVYQLRAATGGVLAPESRGCLYHADRLPRPPSLLEPVSPGSPWLMMPMAGWSFWQDPTLTAKQSASRVPAWARCLCVCWGIGGGYTKHKSTDFYFWKMRVCVCVCRLSYSNPRDLPLLDEGCCEGVVVYKSRGPTWILVKTYNDRPREA